LFLGSSLQAQTKVANYSLGKPGTDKYEHFEFWIKNRKRADINYSYGKKNKEVRLKYLGDTILNNDSCFKVQFSNKYILYIIPSWSDLKVTDNEGKYNKVFRWEYEGPVNGIGTFCDVCAEDETEAIRMIKKYWLKR
jgi:hypothetical protein